MDVLRNGWHPQKKEGRSLRGEVTGLVSRGGKKDTTPSSRSETHASRPLASLKDPDSFGAPPKNVNYHGGAAVPPRTTPDRQGLGTPLIQEALPSSGGSQNRAEEAKRVAPALPYRSNTTGLSTSGLQPPPKPTETTREAGSPPSTKPKPKLPPRLPPRQHSDPSTVSSPPPPYTETAPSPAKSGELLNRNATSRLAQSGFSVPGFGIGNASGSRSAAPLPAEDNLSKPHQASQSPLASSVRGLQGRFTSLSTSTSPPQTAPQDRGGTSWAQKQAALSTASQIQRDPGKVSAIDAKEAVSTANNFRQRHGDEVARGFNKSQQMSQKYGIADKVQSYAERNTHTSTGSSGHGDHAGSAEGTQSNQWVSQASKMAPGVSGFKKGPPPPPPPPTRQPSQPSAVSRSPPPIPMGSKPK